MNFADLDNVEQAMSKSVEAMTDDELVTYIKASLKAYAGLNLAVSGPRERAIMASFKSIYGDDAGPIIKWVFFRYGGTPADNPISYTDFTKGRKWRTDQWHLELQVYRRKDDSRSASRFAQLRDL
jgi:hypothetical protein